MERAKGCQMDGERMTVQPHASLYLTRDEIDIVIAGLSAGLKHHYYEYDCIPTEQIALTAKFQTKYNEFVRCNKCRKLYNKEYSWTQCCGEEEE